MYFRDVILMIIYIFRDFFTHFHFFLELFIQMFEPKFLSIICTRGIMVSSLGLEANDLGSNPNCGTYLFTLFLSIVISLNTKYITLRG